MLIWGGWGILIPLIAAVLLFAGHLVAGQIGAAVGIIVSGVIVWFLGKNLNDKPNRVLFDPNKDEEVVVNEGNRHTLFFIPMQWWGLILFLFGTLLLFAE